MAYIALPGEPGQETWGDMEVKLRSQPRRDGVLAAGSQLQSALGLGA